MPTEVDAQAHSQGALRLAGDTRGHRARITEARRRAHTGVLSLRLTGVLAADRSYSALLSGNRTALDPPGPVPIEIAPAPATML